MKSKTSPNEASLREVYGVGVRPEHDCANTIRMLYV